jgi:hypothetical protein
MIQAEKPVTIMHTGVTEPEWPEKNFCLLFARIAKTLNNTVVTRMMPSS